MFTCIFLNAQDSLLFNQPLNEGELFYKTTLSSLSKPFHWGSEDFTRLGYVTLGAAGLYLLDDDISSFFRRNRSKTMDTFEDIGDQFGKPKTMIPFTLGFTGLGIITKDKWIRETSVLLTSTLAVSGAFQFLLTRTTGRSRPELNKGKHDFNFMSFEKSEHSMPSGHTTIAVSTALVFAGQIDNDIAKYSIYSLAGITMISRVYEQAHFASDVFLGTAVAYYSYQANRYFLDNYDLGTALMILPIENGISLSLTF